MQSISGSEFVFDYVHLLYYKCYKINFNRGGSYIDSLDWIQKPGTNHINQKDNKYFQYPVTVAINHVKSDKIKPFINKYNWERINFQSEKDDWKKTDKNNLTTAFNILILKNKIYIILMFQNITQIVKNELLFNDFERRKMPLSFSKRLSVLLG